MAMLIWLFLSLYLVLLVSPCCVEAVSSKHPHIVFMVADDLGWNDIGFHNPAIITPNLDKLATSGIILNHSYVLPQCSPSRSAFMTSYYPFRLGLQHIVIHPDQKVCAPLNKTFMPQVLKANGYVTHMVGKWHLGFCKWECTPTYRGFDTFLGYYGGREDYYNKSNKGFDFNYNEKVDRAAAGHYSTYQYGDRVTQLIKEHNASQPFFLYFPIQSVHQPLEVPKKYYDMYPNIKTKGRRIFSGMATAMDDVVGRMVQALQDKKMYEDTIIFFTSDNGGSFPYYGNNYPLRGAKETIWEGGARVPGFVHSSKFSKAGGKYDGLMHAVDWFPTIAEAAGVTHIDPNADGMSQWQSISTLSKSKRNEVVYNIDHMANPTAGRAAIRVGDYKLIDGYPGQYNDWYKPDSVWTGPLPRGDYCDAEKLTADVQSGWVNFKGLYNLKVDPLERQNLYTSKPEIVKQLQSRLDYHTSRMVPANYPAADPASNPKNFGGAWTPGWC